MELGGQAGVGDVRESYLTFWEAPLEWGDVGKEAPRTSGQKKHISSIMQYQRRCQTAFWHKMLQDQRLRRPMSEDTI